MGKRKVEVSLAGQTFTVRSDKDEASIHALVNFVSRRFEEIGRQTRLARDELALLVALNIAEELFETEDRAARTREELRRRSERLLGHLDAALDVVGGPPTKKPKTAEAPSPQRAESRGP